MPELRRRPGVEMLGEHGFTLRLNGSATHGDVAIDLGIRSEAKVAAPHVDIARDRGVQVYLSEPYVDVSTDRRADAYVERCGSGARSPGTAARWRSASRRRRRAGAPCA